MRAYLIKGWFPMNITLEVDYEMAKVIQSELRKEIKRKIEEDNYTDIEIIAHDQRRIEEEIKKYPKDWIKETGETE